jgi:malate dehydrogenase
VGREIAHLILAERLLRCDQRLLLVGNPHGPSASSSFGFAADLLDAYAESSPVIDVTLSADEVRGDLIIMAAGGTIPADKGVGRVSRDFLGEQNAPVFERYASALAENGHGNEIVICVSNPNELAVAVFAKHLGRKRVIGMGAFLDSMRFRREIALDLGVQRQTVHGFIAGEHGLNLVPLWSGIHVYGLREDALNKKLDQIRKGFTTERFPRDVSVAVSRLAPLIEKGRIRDAYELVDGYPPDFRVALKPFVTHYSGSKTVTGTARATVELIRMITLGSDALISGQIGLEGEFHGIRGTIGVPFVIGNQGVDRVIELELSPEEKNLLIRCAESVRQKLDRFI